MQETEPHDMTTSAEAASASADVESFFINLAAHLKDSPSRPKGLRDNFTKQKAGATCQFMLLPPIFDSAIQKSWLIKNVFPRSYVRGGGVLLGVSFRF